MRMRYLALLGLLTAACRDVTAPLPAGERWRPPGERELWADVVACSGLRMTPRPPAFYLSNDAFPEYVAADGKTYAAFGLTYLRERRIYIARAVFDDGRWQGTARHEMLHVLLYWNPPHTWNDQHPAKFFREKCGSIL